MTKENKIWIATLLLFSLSAYMAFIYSPELSKLYNYENSYIFFYKQLISLVVGVIIILGLSRLDVVKWFNKIGLALFVFSSFLIVLLQLLPSSGSTTIQGIKTYIIFSNFSIAPMLFFVLGVLWLVSYLYERKKDFKVLVFSIVSILLLGTFYILSSPHRLEQIKTWFSNFSVVPTLETALHETLVLSIMDTIGIFGLFFILVIFMSIFYHILKKEYSIDVQKYFAFAVAILIILDLFLNLLYTLGVSIIAPTLYFVGYGSSIVISTAFMVGMLLMKDNIKKIGI